MGADQVAEIRPFLQEIADAVGGREPRAKDLCATLSVAGSPNAWVQALWGTLNFSYPRRDDPLLRAQSCGVELPPKLTVQTFGARRYVTFTHNKCSPLVLARFIDAFMASVHGLSPEYAIDGQFEHISASG